MSNNWYGLSKAGEEVMVTHEEMVRWAVKTGRTYSVGWLDHYAFGDGEVDEPELKGARLVRAYEGFLPSEVARRVGWSDLADRLHAKKL